MAGLSSLSADAISIFDANDRANIMRFYLPKEIVYDKLRQALFSKQLNFAHDFC